MTISLILSLKRFISLFKLHRICTERAFVRLAEERVCGSCSWKLPPPKKYPAPLPNSLSCHWLLDWMIARWRRVGNVTFYPVKEPNSATFSALQVTSLLTLLYSYNLSPVSQPTRSCLSPEQSHLMAACSQNPSDTWSCSLWLQMYRQCCQSQVTVFMGTTHNFSSSYKSYKVPFNKAILKV